jgi:hypothetical protein
VAGACKCGNEISGSVKFRKFLVLSCLETNYTRFKCDVIQLVTHTPNPMHLVYYVV